MATFPNYKPTYSVGKRSEPRIRTASFGDGYQQRISFGLNQNPKQYDLEFILRDADVNTIEAFLDARAADCTSFNWTPPDSATSYKWICPSWTRELIGAGTSRLQMSFTQVFET